MNIGLNTNRLIRERFEAAFHLKWNEYNKNNGVLRHLLEENVPHVNGGLAIVTQRENQIAATVIQWLGSSVGQCFIRDANELAQKLKDEGFKD